MTQRQMVRRQGPRRAAAIDRIDFWYGYIYIVKAGELFKIGFSKTPRKRFRSFRTGSPVPLEIVFTMKTPYYKMVEKVLHDHFALKRVHGEWFALTDRDIAYVKSLDTVGRSLRSHAYNNAFKDAFDAAEAEGATRTEAQRLGGIAGAECHDRAVALGYPAEWIVDFQPNPT